MEFLWVHDIETHMLSYSLYFVKIHWLKKMINHAKLFLSNLATEIYQQLCNIP